MSVFATPNYSTIGQIIRAHFYLYGIPRNYFNIIHLEFSRNVRGNCEAIWKFYNNSKLSQIGWKDDTTGKKYLFPIKLNFDFRNCAELNKEETIKELITQVYQLSRIYWKTVDQQNLPITILYPSLLAEFLPYFHGENLPNKDFSTKTLWFI